MVLPASPALDASSRAVDRRWIERIARHLELTNRGILLLVNRAQPWCLEPLVRRLEEMFGEVAVTTHAAALARVPMGSTVVFVPRAEDAEALNMARPLFSRNELRVVLFCENGIAEALRRHAPDFFDWLSLVVECPSSHPPHIVSAVRTAIATQARSIAWISDEPNAAAAMRTIFADVVPSATFFIVDSSVPFASFVEVMSKCAARGDWVQIRIDSPWSLRRLRWALGEVSKPLDCVAILPTRMHALAYETGFFPVRGTTNSIALTRARLAAARAESPERLAAWLQGDPDAMDALIQLLVALPGKRVHEITASMHEDRIRAILELARKHQVPLQNQRIAMLSQDIERALLLERPIQLGDAKRPAEPFWLPAEMALRAYRSGDFDAGSYFAERARGADAPDDEITLELLEGWLNDDNDFWFWPDEIEPSDERWLDEDISLHDELPVEPIILDQWPAAPHVDLDVHIMVEQLASRLDLDEQNLLKQYLADMDWADIAAADMATTAGKSPNAIRDEFHQIVLKLRRIVQDDED